MEPSDPRSRPRRRWLGLAIALALFLILGTAWWLFQAGNVARLRDSLVKVDRLLDRDFAEAKVELKRAQSLATSVGDPDWVAVTDSYAELLVGLETSNPESAKHPPNKRVLNPDAAPEAKALLGLARIRWNKWVENTVETVGWAEENLRTYLNQPLDENVLHHIRNQWLAHRFVYDARDSYDELQDVGLDSWLENDSNPGLEYLHEAIDALASLPQGSKQAQPKMHEATVSAIADKNFMVAANLQLWRACAAGDESDKVSASHFFALETELLDRIGNPAVGRRMKLSIAMYLTFRLDEPNDADRLISEITSDPGYANTSENFQSLCQGVRDRAKESIDPDYVPQWRGPEGNPYRDAIVTAASVRAEEDRLKHEHAIGAAERARLLLMGGLTLAIVLPLGGWLVGQRVKILRSRRELQRQKDITEDQQREVEKLSGKLARLQRMESLGLMAGSIAHDFNNILVGVNGNAELMELAYDSGTCDEAFARQRIEAIKQSSQRASKLAKQMLAYAGKRYAEQRVQDLNQLLSSNRSVLESFSQRGQAIEYQLDPEPMLACVDETQVEQVLFNLVTNAMQASPPNTPISIGSHRLRLTDAETHDCFGSRSEGGEFCGFTVEDQGVGIQQGSLDRIFEPYYSTSEHGRGLGLAVVYGIVESHGGLIRCRSDVGRGTTFEVLFPAVESDTPLAHPRPRPAAAFSEGMLQGVQVLVIDDEASVLDTCRQMLEHSGVHATVANGGEAGLEQLVGGDDRFDCVLMDVVMPDLSAAQVLEELERREIQVPVILMSGFSADRLDRFGTRPNVVQILSKPFGVEQLQRAIAVAVGTSGNPGAADPAAADLPPGGQ